MLSDTSIPWCFSLFRELTRFLPEFAHVATRRRMIISILVEALVTLFGDSLVKCFFILTPCTIFEKSEVCEELFDAFSGLFVASLFTHLLLNVMF